MGNINFNRPYYPNRNERIDQFVVSIITMVTGIHDSRWRVKYIHTNFLFIHINTRRAHSQQTRTRLMKDGPSAERDIWSYRSAAWSSEICQWYSEFTEKSTANSSSYVAVVAFYDLEPTDATSSWQNAASFDKVQSPSESSAWSAN